MKLTFEQSGHVYRVDGRVVPGVSSVIARGGWIDDVRAFYTEESQRRGTRVHRACLDIDLGSFSGEAFEVDAGFIESYLQWRRLVRPVWSTLETLRYSKHYDLCGCADRVGVDGSGRPLVLDLKTGAKQKWHRYQLALYDLIYDDIPARIRRRVSLHLQRDGSIARGEEYIDPSDYDRALRLLRTPP